MITQNDIIYFIVTDRFFDGDSGNNFDFNRSAPRKFHGGDLKGIIDKLPYIKKLGVTAIWLTPVYQNIEEYFGDNPYHYYWPRKFNEVDKHLVSEPEGLDYLKKFVKTCHENELKVILDIVVNHVGYGVNESGEFNGILTFNGDFNGLPVIDLNDSNNVDYFINNLIFWIEGTAIDGLRMDMAKDIPAKFWYYYKSIIKGKFPDIFIVGEVLDTSNIGSNSKFQNSYDLNSIFDFPLQQAITDVFIRDEDFSNRIARKRLNDNEPKGTLDLDDPSNGGYYTNANRLVTLLDNHDLDSGRIISIARQYHAGNNEGKTMAYKIVEMCYAFLLTARGIPQIYYGSEIGLEGWKNNPDNGNNNDSDLRRDFPWEKIDGNNEVNPGNDLEKSLLETIKSLIILRKESQALKYGVRLTLWSDTFVYAFLTYYQNEVVAVIFNNGYDRMPYPLNIPIVKSNNKNIQVVPDRIIDLLDNSSLSDYKNPAEQYSVSNGFLSVVLEGKSYKILKNHSL
jgi:alpha-amylase